MDASENVAAVRRMQAYIQDHLSEPITLHQLAAEAGYSPYHSARMFRAHVSTLSGVRLTTRLSSVQNAA